jgi:flagellar protein FlgJ
MELPSINSSVKASVVPFEKLASNPNVSQQDKVAEACRQFEAILLKQILSEARKSSAMASSSQESNVSSIYDDMINNQYAESMSHSGSFGLAASLQKQLMHLAQASTPGSSKNAPSGHVPSSPAITKPIIHD